MTEIRTNPVTELITRDALTPRRILVVGDCMTDIYVYGRLEECQDGCQKFLEEKTVTVPGGAANAAQSIHNWFARVLCPRIKRMNVSPANNGPIKTRFILDNKCIFRHDNERNGTDFEDTRRNILEVINWWKPEGVLISDYTKGLLDTTFTAQVIKACLERNIPVVADAKRAPEFYHSAIIKANSAWGHRCWEKDGPHWTTKYPGPMYVETHGAVYPSLWKDGAWVDLDGVYLDKICLPTVDCINHVGAGDCFGAHLVLALANGMGIEDSVAIAHSAGRVYVQHSDNRPPLPEEIEADYAKTIR